MKFEDYFSLEESKLYDQLKDAKNTQELYHKAFGFVIAQQEEAKGDLQYLDIDIENQGNLITFSLTKWGELVFKGRLLKEKKNVLERWKKEGDDEKIADISKTLELIDSINTRIGSIGGINPFIDQEINENTSKVDNFIEEIDALILEYIPKKTFEGDLSVTYQNGQSTNLVKTYIDALEAYNIESKSIKDALSNVVKHEEFQKQLIQNVLDGTADRVRKNPAQATNRTRAKAIIDLLKVENTPIKLQLEKLALRPGNQQFYDKVHEILNPAMYHLLDNSSVAFNDIYYVRAPAFKKLIKDLKEKHGITALERVKKKSFDRDAIVRTLAEQLLTTTNDLLGKLPLKLNVNLNPSVQLFLLDTLDTLNKKIKGILDTGKTEDFVSTNFTNISQHQPPSLYARPLLKFDNTQLTFYNCEEQSFYYFDAQRPHLGYVEGRYIDFINKDMGTEIDDKGQITESVLSGMTEQNRKRWFNQKLGGKGQRDWRALYQTTSNVLQPNVYLIWEVAGRGGSGIGRADKIADDLYLWSYVGKYKKEEIAELLGLSLDRELNNFDYSFDDSSTVVTVTNKNEPPEEQIDTYIQVTTPHNSFLLKTASKQLPFQINYYRRVELVDGEWKVVKNQNQAQNRPQVFDADLVNDFIPMSLPYNFNNLITPSNYKVTDTEEKRAVIKNKGKSLFRNTRAREDAGSVMSTIRGGLKDGVQKLLLGSNSKLSASDLSQAVLRHTAIDTQTTPNTQIDSKARTDWRALKQTSEAVFPTDQEWCHLRGHGDGGEEKLGNFVSGSFHCNTEQLAIELGQRPVTQVSAEGDYILHSTAYLLQDDSMDSASEGLYGDLNTDGEKGNKDLKKNNAPIAAFIRYKIYKEEVPKSKVDEEDDVIMSSPRKVKIFDYTYEGQSEFFDVNQYRILHYTVRAIIDPNWFAEKLEGVDTRTSKKRKTPSSNSNASI